MCGVVVCTAVVFGGLCVSRTLATPPPRCHVTHMHPRPVPPPPAPSWVPLLLHALPLFSSGGSSMARVQLFHFFTQPPWWCCCCCCSCPSLLWRAEEVQTPRPSVLTTARGRGDAGTVEGGAGAGASGRATPPLPPTSHRVVEVEAAAVASPANAALRRPALSPQRGTRVGSQTSPPPQTHATFQELRPPVDIRPPCSHGAACAAVCSHVVAPLTTTSLAGRRCSWHFPILIIVHLWFVHAIG